MAEISQQPPEPKWHLGPLEIKRTTDVLAFVAFILSTIGLMAQAKDYLRGPEVVLFGTEPVTFGRNKTFKEYFAYDDEFVLLTATMSYVNAASVGLNGVIRREYLRFETNGVKFQYAAHEVVDTRAETSELVTAKKGDSGPFAINGASSVTHEILFEPHPVRCAAHDVGCKGSLPGLRWDKFLMGIKQNPTIRVTLLADSYEKSTVFARCNVVLSRIDIQSLEKNGWSAPDCHEEKEPSFLEKLFITGNETESEKKDIK